MTRPITSIATGFLRLAAMSGKFVLLVALAVYIDASDLGLYGLVVATVSYALYVVGLDFYTFSSREFLGVPRTSWNGLLRSEATLFGINYVVAVLLLLVLFAVELLPWGLAFWCCALLVIEHVAQELTRLFVIAGEPLFASVLMFVRQGSWCYVLVGLMSFWEEARSLTGVLAAWTVASSLTCILGMLRLRRLSWGSWTRAVDWQWIRQGLRIALPLLGSTLALRALLTADRYLQKYFTDLETLGAYVLYIGMAGAVLAFLDGAVHAFVYPALITAVHSGQTADFRRLMASLLVRTVLTCVVFVPLVLFLTPVLLERMGRPEYLEHGSLLPWLVVAVCVHAVGLVPHFGLYALRRDRHILGSQILGLALFVPVSFALSLSWAEQAVAMALCFSFLTIAVWKAAAFLFSVRELSTRDAVPNRQSPPPTSAEPRGSWPDVGGPGGTQ